MNIPTLGAKLPVQKNQTVKYIHWYHQIKNLNITPFQKELLKGNLRLVYIGLKHVQWLGIT